MRAHERLQQLCVDEERLLGQLYADEAAIGEELIRAEGVYVPGSAGSRSTGHRARELAAQRLQARNPELHAKLCAELAELHREESRLWAQLHPGQVDPLQQVDILH